ncbi:MAG: hypothetical protein WC365_01460 [Candidatus Babeliales bacterium]|jgi:hypothetical protein
MIFINVEVKSGVYKIRKPMGRMGALHFGIITKYMPANKKAEGDPMSPMEQERIGEGFEQWAQKVLPNLLISFTPKDSAAPKDSITIDDVSGEDQYSLFLAVCSTMETSETFFRIV